MSRVLVTGASGYVGSALVPRLLHEGHEVRAFARDARRVRADVPVVTGDVSTGAGLAAALDGIDVAYYLIHSMERAAGPGWDTLERESAERFRDAARAAGVARVVYLGGLVPDTSAPSRHLASRLVVEEVLLDAAPCSVAFRASIVVGARSRSFRFLVRLVERLPFLALPGWHANRTRPVDERDVLAFLLAGGFHPAVEGPLSLDIGGPDVLSYGDMIERIRDLMLLARPALRLKLTMTPVAAQVAAAVAGEDPALIEPLMEGLGSDLLPRDDRAARLLEVRLHRFDAAVEHALRDWEAAEPLAAR
jgi:uncharacterized protein YbjT (DUF2867 family)